MKTVFAFLTVTAGVCQGGSVVGQYGDGNMVDGDVGATVVGGDMNTVRLVNTFRFFAQATRGVFLA